MDRRVLRASRSLAVLLGLGTSTTDCAMRPDDAPGAGVAAATSAITLTLQDGVAPSASYAGTRDTTLEQYRPTTSLGASTSLRVDGDDPAGSGKDLVTLVRWDLGSVPSSSTLQSAKMVLAVSNSSGGTYVIYEALRAWNESQASWNQAATGQPWQAAGAAGASDRGSTPLGSITASATGTYTVTLNAAGIAVVQRWITTPGSNAGFVLAGGSSDGLAFASREASSASQRPKLVLSYLPPADGDGGTSSSTDAAADARTSADAAADARTANDAATASDTGAPSDAGAVATGRSYYVDSVAGRDTNSGTSEQSPWQSLAKANAAPLAPGDRLWFRRDGSWTGKLTLGRSGTSTAAITVGAYGTGAPPVIHGASTCVDVTGAYLVVRELHADDCSWAGISLSGHHNRVEDNRVTHNVAGIHLRATAQFNLVRGNTLLDNNKMSVLTAGGDDDSGAFGVLLQGDDNEIASNVISGCDAFSYDYGRDGGAVEIYGGQRNNIHHNLALDNDAFSELGDARSADNTFAYNVVRSSLASSTFLVTRGASSGYGPVMRTALYNNTVRLTGASSQGVVCHGGCGPTILRMRNNIVAAVAKAVYADSAFDEDYDLFVGARQFPSVGAHSLAADPLFVDPAANDLHLRAASPAIDKGVSLGLARDFEQFAVPVDGDGNGVAVVDIGAYEFRR